MDGLVLYANAKIRIKYGVDVRYVKNNVSHFKNNGHHFTK